MSATHHSTPVPIELEVRRKGGHDGKRYWKSLEDLADAPGFLQFLHREFPEQASEFADPEGRRNFMKVMGASLAFAGLTGCTRQPEEKIVPYVRSPEEMVPGRPQFFASAVLDGGYAKGVLVESHHGRPTKIEGNPEHPASLGATDARGQASILDLYDPDRAQNITDRGEIRSFSIFVDAMRLAAGGHKAGGAGFRLLTETVTSPTLAQEIETVLAQYPGARWHQWEPAGRNSARLGAQMAFGEQVEARYHFDRAAVVVSLDSDVLGEGPANVRYMRDFATRRKLQSGTRDMLRLYAVESAPSITGSMADHRLTVRASAVEDVARAIAAALGVGGGTPVAAEGSDPRAQWIAAMVKDLQRFPGAALVVPGDCQSPAVHALAHLLNDKLGAVGRTVTFTAPVEASPVDQLASLRELVADMDKGAVSMLVILGGNPVYNAPADLAFGEKLDKVLGTRVYLGQHVNETAERCHWNVNEAHPLEAWGDARAYDGTVTVVQPLIAPLYAGKSALEVVNALGGGPQKSGYELVRAYWQKQGAADFERRWRRILHDGLVAGSALPERAVTVRAAGDWMTPRPRVASPGFELIFRPDPTIGDGRYANNGWLQELPKPLTKLTWDNAVLLSPRTARRLGIENETTARGIKVPVVEVEYRGRRVTGGAWIQPGHPDDAATLHLGYGRRRGGRVGTGMGFDAYALRASDTLWAAQGAQIAKTGDTILLACTQDHWSMEERDPVRAANLGEYLQNPDYARDRVPDPPRDMTLYPNFKYDGHAWGMAVDLNSCTGCNACVVACVAENNIPVVGKEQVAHGREMHWLRIDRYYAGSEESPTTYHQPMACVHCENAPCEVVCPVAATVHSEEGLNDMVYNRCVGTRYCSNNCPYKVRRFNFFLYADWNTESLKLQRNPDVTVRSRGVMEKCTYCVQRINLARVDAKNQNREMREGDVVTACQGACPTRAITFGDLNDPESEVSRWKKEPRNFGVLTDLNVRPRTTYLGAVKNPNPEMPGNV